MIDLDEIKSRINVREFAEEIGLDVNSQHKTLCWHGDERTPSLHLYDDGWYCYRCGEGGDIIDMVIQLKHWSWKRSARFLEEYAGESLTLDEPVHKNEKAEVPDMLGEAEIRCISWTPPHHELIERSWGTELHDVIVDYVLPCAEGLMIPHIMPDGDVNGIKLRYWDGSKGAVPGSQFTAGLYRPPGFRRESNTTVLCEGESDAWAMASVPGATYDVLALPSGAGCWKDEWRFNLGSHVLIVMDNDAAGFSASEKISKSLKQPWQICDVPTGIKDAREAIAKGWRLSRLGDWVRAEDEA